MAIKFSTPKDFPKPDDVKKEGDTHRFLADLECIGIKDDGSMEWELEALDGVKLPEDEKTDDQPDDSMEGYDDSQDEPDDSAPKNTKDLAASLLAPPAQ